jgi:hypothetical protein
LKFMNLQRQRAELRLRQIHAHGGANASLQRRIARDPGPVAFTRLFSERWDAHVILR